MELDETELRHNVPAFVGQRQKQDSIDLSFKMSFKTRHLEDS